MLHFVACLLAVSSVFHLNGINAQSTASPDNVDKDMPIQPEMLSLPVYSGEIASRKEIPKSSFHPAFTFCGKKAGVSDFNPLFNGKNFRDVLVDCSFDAELVLHGNGSKKITAFSSKNYDHGCWSAPVCTNTDYKADGSSGISREDPTNDNQPFVVPGPKPDDYKDNPDICNHKRYSYSAQGTEMFTNDQTCYLGDVQNQLKIAEAPKKEDPASVYYITPRWMKPDENEYIKKYIRVPQDDKIMMGPQPYAKFVETVDSTKKWHDCKSTCDQGDIVKLTLPMTSWSFRMYLDSNCQSIKICLGSSNHADNNQVPECKAGGTWYILLKNNVIAWPNGGRAGFLNMRTGDPVALEVGYGVKFSDDTVSAELYVKNSQNMKVTSESQGFPASMVAKIAIFFSEPNCLIQEAGIVSDNVQAGTLFTKNEAVVTAKDGSKADGEAVNGETGEEFVVAPVEEPDVIELTTTVKPPSAFADKLKWIEPVSAGDNNATYVEGKWWTWALYLGFLVGSLLVVGIGGGVFYMMRRTVFAFWYRGMFKRYGCDASGTTGGITGVGFGATTTGAMTVGGTTGGTTAGGTTGGGTTGATTSSMTKTTGGSNTLAM